MQGDENGKRELSPPHQSSALLSGEGPIGKVVVKYGGNKVDKMKSHTA
jgi:hypothetical protein